MFNILSPNEHHSHVPASFLCKSYLARDKARQLRRHLLRKDQRSSACVFHAFVGQHRRIYANQRSVSPVQANSIRDHVRFGHIFIRDAPPVCLVPVEDKLFGLAGS